MLRALETQFTDTNASTDEFGRKRWHLPSSALRDLMSLSPEELAALDIAVETLKRSGLAVEADDLLGLREKILALVPRSKAARLETDHEALLEAQGLAARPGPRQRIDRKIAAAISEAIKSCRILEVEYQSRGEAAPRARRLGTYRAIRKKHMVRYLAEFEWRFNHRFDLAAMIPALGRAAVRTPPATYSYLKWADYGA